MEVSLAFVADWFKQLRKVMQPTSRDEFAVLCSNMHDGHDLSEGVSFATQNVVA